MVSTPSGAPPEKERPAADLAMLALAGASLDEVEAAARRTEERARAEGDPTLLARVGAILDAARARSNALEELERSRAELADAQRIGRIGSFDLDLSTGESRWSDEMYRIMGVEPRSFQPTSDQAMGFVLPEEREAVREIHRQAVETGAPYHVVVPIVRPDGQRRILETWGEVVADESGSPVRVRGVSRDVTEQREAERSAELSRDRLAALVESTPDALLVVDASGTIRDANSQVETILGYPRDELIGSPIETLLPARYRDVHESHRARFFGNPNPRSMGVGLDLFACRKDGTEIPVDVALGTLTGGGDPLVVAFVRDVSERRRAEYLASRLRDAELARQQALEINDNVVQGLVTALMRLELDDIGESEVVAGLRKTLAAARGIISDLLGEGDVEPGALVRTQPADQSRS